MRSNLVGKKILVTGGSRGIGAAIVTRLAELGAKVAFTYASREDSAQEVLKKLPGDGHFILKLNIADETSIESASKEILEKWGAIDGLVNNAGITKDGLLVRMKTQDFDDVINANLRGCFLLIRAFSKSMMKARSGSIVNITSVIGQTGNAGQANYAASKGGVVAMSKSIALELAARSIRVNCVAPGFIATEMTDSLTDEQKKTIIDKVPMATIGEPNDVANAVCFLLSDEAKYITGHTLSVNGGLFME